MYVVLIKLIINSDLKIVLENFMILIFKYLLIELQLRYTNQ